jgi:hypothetical protein
MSASELRANINRILDRVLGQAFPWKSSAKEVFCASRRSPGGACATAWFRVQNSSGGTPTSSFISIGPTSGTRIMHLDEHGVAWLFAGELSRFPASQL